jgi:Uma2 family endonuclease
MEKDSRIAVDEYLSWPEELARRELVWGVVREPPAPRYGHQAVVTRLTVLLDAHVRRHAVGTVVVSPIDVVLDKDRALILQPDVLFISKGRAHIMREQIWGAPDLVVEVASRGTRRYDRTVKLEWYRTYGVRECWLVNPDSHVVTVVALETGAAAPRTFRGEQRVESRVLPEFHHTAAELFS